MGVSNCRFAVRAPAPFRQLPARARRPPDYIATRRRAASRRHPKVARLAAIGVHAGATQSPQCFSQRQPRGRRNPKRWGRTSWSEAHAAGVTGAWGEGGRVGCARRAVLLFRRLCTSLSMMCHGRLERLVHSFRVSLAPSMKCRKQAEWRRASRYTALASRNYRSFTAVGS